MAESRSRIDLLAGVAIGVATSFGSQLLWRSYSRIQQAPALNLHLLPVQIRVDTSSRCPLDRERLRQLAGSEAFTRTLEPEARFALQVFAQSNTASIRGNALSSELMAQFAALGITSKHCASKLSAPLSLEVAYVLHEQVPYVLKRRCKLLYKGQSLPAVLSTADSAAPESDPARPVSDAMVIGSTGIYFASILDDGRGGSSLVSSILSSTPTELEPALRMQCNVITDDRKLTPVGNARPVPVPINRSAAPLP